MTGLLLDTHVVLWLLDDNSRLGRFARERITNSSAVFVSAASIWEMSIKAASGKLALPADLDGGIAASGLQDLPITRGHAMACDVTALPHRDPFDAMLVAQAAVERLTLVTADEKLLAALPDVVDARH